MNRSSSRGSTFLMEIMAAILFFSLVSALCLQMFLKSSQLSKDTANLSSAASQVRNAAELIKHAASSSAQADKNSFFPECLLEEYPNAATGSVQTVVYFDKKWNYCPAGDAAFCMKITPTNTEDASLLHFYFEVLHMNGSKDDIYSMDLELHVPNQP